MRRNANFVCDVQKDQSMYFLRTLRTVPKGTKNATGIQPTPGWHKFEATKHNNNIWTMRHSCSSHFHGILSIFLFLITLTYFASSQLIEEERLEEYYARNHTWPPKINPDTPGWNKLMSRRFRQLEFVEDSSARYSGYISAVTSTYFCRCFLQYNVLYCTSKLIKRPLLWTTTIDLFYLLLLAQAPILHQTLLKMDGDWQGLLRLVRFRPVKKFWHEQP